MSYNGIICAWGVRDLGSILDILTKKNMIYVIEFHSRQMFGKMLTGKMLTLIDYSKIIMYNILIEKK